MVPKRQRRHEPKRDPGELVTVQEANAKEVKIEGKRPAILLELQVAAPEVLRHLSLAGERTAVLQFCEIFCLVFLYFSGGETVWRTEAFGCYLYIRWPSCFLIACLYLRSILAATQWLCVCDSSACSLSCKRVWAKRPASDVENDMKMIHRRYGLKQFMSFHLILLEVASLQVVWRRWILLSFRLLAPCYSGRTPNFQEGFGGVSVLSDVYFGFKDARTCSRVFGVPYGEVWQLQ